MSDDGDTGLAENVAGDGSGKSASDAEPSLLPDTAAKPPAKLPAGEDETYRVLARKYRPSTFDDLIGQDAMVRTLTNAFAAGRIAQAYMLTGVRGVGKTTTARILARALNYEPVSVDDTSKDPGPTVVMPGLGIHCEAIIGSHHPDVVEMDAASHTGIDDVREIIDAVRYRPMSARYKVYIIDEVHMLSRQAFNGLLKTLEEPPAHARFIFATTEIRKVPVTVLSRCQRFDLRRIGADLLVEQFRSIAASEGATITDEALALIARAAEGSSRDGLSLLDQAIAQGSGAIEADAVRDMLSLADRARVIDLFEAGMSGDAAKALEELKSQYQAGADPLVVLADMAEFVHLVTRAKVVETSLDDPSLAEVERVRAKGFAAGLDMAALARAWQMLTKGLGEVEASSRPLAAADMVLVRMAYAANLPTPGDVIRQLPTGTVTAAEAKQSGEAGSKTPEPASASSSAAPSSTPSSPSATGGVSAPEIPAVTSTPALAPVSEPETPATAEVTPWEDTPNPQNFAEAAALVGDFDIRLAHIVETSVRPVSFAQGKIEISLKPDAPRDLAFRFGRTLERATARKWLVSVASETGGQTLREAREQAETRREEAAAAHPVVQAVMAQFPGAKIVDIRDPEPVENEDDGKTEAGGNG